MPLPPAVLLAARHLDADEGRRVGGVMGLNLTDVLLAVVPALFIVTVLGLAAWWLLRGDD